MSRKMVPYFIVIWVAFLALSGMAPCGDLRSAAAPHSLAGESEPGYVPADHGVGGSRPHHLGDAAEPHDHDSPHSHCCQLGNAEYDITKAGVTAGALRIPAPVFLLATVDAGLLPQQAVEALLVRPSIYPPPPKQPLYLRIKRFLI
ncbi:MAG: hypothetical protein ACYC7I_13300 [Gammaproteobacteria bacterium]